MYKMYLFLNEHPQINIQYQHTLKYVLQKNSIWYMYQYTVHTADLTNILRQNDKYETLLL